MGITYIRFFDSKDYNWYFSHGAICYSSFEKCHWWFDRDCIKLVDGFGKYGH